MFNKGAEKRKSKFLKSMEHIDVEAITNAYKNNKLDKMPLTQFDELEKLNTTIEIVKKKFMRGGNFPAQIKYICVYHQKNRECDTILDKLAQMGALKMKQIIWAIDYFNPPPEIDLRVFQLAEVPCLINMANGQKFVKIQHCENELMKIITKFQESTQMKSGRDTSMSGSNNGGTKKKQIIINKTFANELKKKGLKHHLVDENESGGGEDEYYPNPNPNPPSPPPRQPQNRPPPQQQRQQMVEPEEEEDDPVFKASFKNADESGKIKGGSMKQFMKETGKGIVVKDGDDVKVSSTKSLKNKYPQAKTNLTPQQRIDQLRSLGQ